jgi:Tfp pilus assembly protein PilV
MPRLSAKPGFTLLEIVITLLLIMAIVTLLFAFSGTLSSSRGSNLQSIATKVASKQVESLRKTSFDSLPPSGGFSDPDLARLPQATATRTISDYQSSTDIKQILIQVDWVVNGANKNVKIETFIYRYGL